MQAFIDAMMSSIYVITLPYVKVGRPECQRTQRAGGSNPHALNPVLF